MLYADVFVMVTDFSFGAGGEDRLSQLLGFLQAFGQLNAADFAGFLVAVPTAAGDVAANDAFDRQHVQLFAFHAVACEFGFLEEFGHIFGINGNHMVRNNVFSQIEPEFGDLSQHSAFFHNHVFQNMVKCGNTVSGNHNNAVTNIIHLTNLAGFKRFVLLHFNAS